MKKLLFLFVFLINVHCISSMDVERYHSFEYSANPLTPFFKQFDHLLKKSSLKKINSECKKVARRDSSVLEHPFIQDVLLGKKDLENEYEGTTALIIACVNNRIPIIVDLLKQGANFEAQDEWGFNCYNSLMLAPSGNCTVSILREVFNNGSCVLNSLLIKHALQKICVHNKDYVADIALVINQFYIQLLEVDLFPEAFLWKQDCVQACELEGIKEKDAIYCLMHILFMSQNKKTELNKRLFLKTQELQSPLYGWASDNYR